MFQTTALLKISDCKTVHDLCRLLNVEYSQISTLLYPNPSKSYFGFDIPKKSGGVRRLSAPNEKLKKIQHILLEKIKPYYKPMAISHGFVEGRSIKTNASFHTNKKFVFNLDLRNFFNSIHFGRVKNLFKSPPFSLNDNVATVIAQICCKDNNLPMGAPTSPLISNMIALKLDKGLVSLAKLHRCHVTRYVDDITFSFSCSKKAIPTSILNFSDDGQVIAGDNLMELIVNNGFEINLNKVRLSSRSRNQEVTGLTVNQKVNIKRSYLKQTQAMVHAAGKFGFELASREYIDKYLVKELPLLKVDDQVSYFVNMVRGRINFIRSIRGVNDPFYRKLANVFFTAIGKNNPKFLKHTLESALKSTFIIENEKDINCGTCFNLLGFGLVTNEHVVSNAAISSLNDIKFYDHLDTNSCYHPIKAKRIVKNIDLAVFDIDQSLFPRNLTGLKLGDSAEIDINSTVTILGFPDYSRGDTPRITYTQVVGKKKYLSVDIYIVSDPIFHGNSGGPVLNEKFEVVGIATNGGTADKLSSINGFIPINNVRDYL